MICAKYFPYNQHRCGRLQVLSRKAGGRSAPAERDARADFRPRVRRAHTGAAVAEGLCVCGHVDPMFQVSF